MVVLCDFRPLHGCLASFWVHVLTVFKACIGFNNTTSWPSNGTKFQRALLHLPIAFLMGKNQERISQFSSSPCNNRRWNGRPKSQNRISGMQCAAELNGKLLIGVPVRTIVLVLSRSDRPSLCVHDCSLFDSTCMVNIREICYHLRPETYLLYFENSGSYRNSATLHWKILAAWFPRSHILHFRGISQPKKSV